MTRYFARSKLADTFYGQRVENHPSEPTTEFEVIGVTTDLITAARVPTDKRRFRTVHVFSRHTGLTDDGWAHAAYFGRWRWPTLTFRGKEKAIAWITFLTLVAICVLIATWPIAAFSS